MPLWVALLAVAVCAFAIGSWQCMMVAALLLLDWFLATSVVNGTGDAASWAAFWLIDLFMAVGVILVGDRIRWWQVAVAAMFGEMIGCHTLFGYSSQTTGDFYHYWWRLHYLAWAQLWIVAIWGLSDAIGCVRRIVVRHRASHSEAIVRGQAS